MPTRKWTAVTRRASSQQSESWRRDTIAPAAEQGVNGDVSPAGNIGLTSGLAPFRRLELLGRVRVPLRLKTPLERDEVRKVQRGLVDFAGLQRPMPIASMQTMIGQPANQRTHNSQRLRKKRQRNANALIISGNSGNSVNCAAAQRHQEHPSYCCTLRLGSKSSLTIFLNASGKWFSCTNLRPPDGDDGQHSSTGRITIGMDSSSNSGQLRLHHHHHHQHE